MNELICPHCSSGKFAKHGIYTHLNGLQVQRYQCKNCCKGFFSEYQKRSTVTIELNCIHCGSHQLNKAGFYRLNDGQKIQQYRCQHCRKRFTSEYRNPPAELANIDCPSCNSLNTVKAGTPINRKHNTVQQCLCKNCGKRFNYGGRKRLKLYLKGELIHSFWNCTGLNHMPDVACPNCNQEKAILKTETWDSRRRCKIRQMICLGCGQDFKGEGRPWNNHTISMLEKAVSRQPWQFENEKWDLRELYQNYEEHKFRSFFLDFSRCGDEWFKYFVKAYVLWLIKTGVKVSTLRTYMSIFRSFGSFLREQEVTSLKEVDRLLMANYWSQKRSHIAKNYLYQEMRVIINFFDWGNTEKRFTTAPGLITTYDRPKIFHDEPDPLEYSVLEAIRNKIYVLPESLQLQFILGFWLGTRPSELSYIRKDCCSLDPNGSIWWLAFERDKPEDSHKLPITTDLVRLIQKQQDYIKNLFEVDYPYLFCHYQNIGQAGFPNYLKIKPLKRPPMIQSSCSPMVKAIRHLIEYYDIRDSNRKIAHFTGNILRPTRATHFISNGYSLEFVRIWLKHRSANTTKRHYTRYQPGELLDVACVMANLDGKFIPYDSNPESLRQNPEQHELDGLKMLSGEPLYGYCIFREFCPRFGHCYTCGFHVASADKLPYYKAQLERLRAKKTEVFNYGSAEMLNSYTEVVNALEGKVTALETVG